jgi:hypothetical protein
MFGSSAPANVSFDVAATDDGTELFLINGDFELVAKAIGKATFSAPPGLYKLKVRSGNTTVENVIAVREGMKPIAVDPVPLVSPLPLANSATTSPSHEAAVRDAVERPPDVNAGSGSAIVIVVRHAKSCPQPDTMPENPGSGLRLLTMDGAIVADVEAQGKIGGDASQPIVTLHAAVAPGPYRLSLTRADDRRVEQIVVASRGWQTQFFTFLHRSGRADFVNSSITIRKGFTPDDAALRLEQIALGAFRDDRKILSEAMRARIADPAAPPMLALLGALLLIREAKTSKQETEDSGGEGERVDNRAAVAVIVENLRAALAPDSHPDVEAIAIGAGNANPAYEFRSPPMYRASWRLLLKASAADPRLIAPSSFAASVATRQWGEGPWFLYFDPADAAATARMTGWHSGALELLADIGEAKPSAEAPSLFTKLRALVTPLDRTPFPKVPRVEVAQAFAAKAAVDVGKIRAQLDDATRKLLVKRLGVPMSSIEAWLDELEK